MLWVLGSIYVGIIICVGLIDKFDEIRWILCLKIYMKFIIYFIVLFMEVMLYLIWSVKKVCNKFEIIKGWSLFVVGLVVVVVVSGE